MVVLVLKYQSRLHGRPADRGFEYLELGGESRTFETQEIGGLRFVAVATLEHTEDVPPLDLFEGCHR